ncbi:hypothetical protein PAESOLCIP111_06654 [Paenibacillus solanacearum]|uniref:HTH cro/C1-type domain-containing protein n=1 Tax=Paenibacillus solanacearum TaxID=2048548 RepID=A0A916K8A7_9BACL|nr:helix-turn-helix domain-containing protein [Paenibacillus solanacearum]CAG7652852.1 hypothetical protein PAESOLCIP111_06654 [Paenibacillus solanacearum]
MPEKSDYREWPEEMIRRLRQRLRANGKPKLRQSDLARSIGVDTRTIQQWEIGERLPSAHNLQKLIQVLLDEEIWLAGLEKEEAKKLWETVGYFHDQRSGHARLYPVFDEKWFDGVLAATGSSRYEPLPDIPARQQERATRRMPTNIQARSFVLIGRRQEIKGISEVLANAPLVTLVGPGGCGKTRLACQIATELLSGYSDGVWLVELASVQESDEMGPIRILASLLGARERQGYTLVDVISDNLRDKQMLFVLDNCEHLLEASAELAELLLSASSSITVLATSREPLGLMEERVWSVPPLAYPDSEDTAASMALESVMSFEAVQLFVERARMADTRFTVSQDDISYLVRICERLQGIPLSLELAASRINFLSLREIEERLSDMLVLLSSGKRKGAIRHQSLYATVAWSYELLSEKERSMLQQLSVFSGYFDLEAVEAICGNCAEKAASGGAEPRICREEALDLVASLVNKSLIATADTTRQGGKRRLFLHESIRQFAVGAWLKDGNKVGNTSIRYYHAAYYRGLTNQAGARFRSVEREDALSVIRQGYSDIIAALDWSCSRVEAKPIALSIASDMYYYWLHSGVLHEGIARLRQVIQSCEDHAAHPDYAKLSHGLGVLLWVLGDSVQARSYARMSMEGAKELGDAILMASNLRLLAQIALQHGELSEAEGYATTGVQLVRDQGDQWQLASALSALGNLHNVCGDFEQAERVLSESVVLFEKVKDYWELTGPLRTLGYMALHKREVDSAVELFRRSIAACQRYQGEWFLARGLEGLASSLCFKGEWAKAAVLLGASESMREKLGSPIHPHYRDIYDQTMEILERECEPELRLEAWNRGRGMIREQIIVCALEG